MARNSSNSQSPPAKCVCAPAIPSPPKHIQGMPNLGSEYLLNTLADPFELSNIVFYFAPHWETFPDPIRSSDFCTCLERCDIFLLEYSEQWMVQEPDLECKYNRLAHGEIRRIREG